MTEQMVQFPNPDYSIVKIPQWFLDRHEIEYGRSKEPMPANPLAAAWHVVCCLWWGVVWFWLKRLWKWCMSKPTKERARYFDAIGMARTYEDWMVEANVLDLSLRYDRWRGGTESPYYNWDLILKRIDALRHVRGRSDITATANLLRTGLVRNYANITSTQLYNQAYSGTKDLIETYIREVVICVDQISNAPTTTTSDKQHKLNILNDTKRTYGQSALVLQGGSIFGLCHLGVIKALHLRGLLPKVISGTATGALIAALIGVKRDSELLGALSGSRINVEAFTNQATGGRWYQTLIRRVRRWWRTGHFLDIEVLDRLLQANVGDMTFEEAHKRTGRILNITVTTSTCVEGGNSAPTALNHITASNVLIRSAALASNATSSSTLYNPGVTVLCKNFDNTIIPWPLAVPASSRNQPRSMHRDRESPLAPLKRLFGVNHYIVSQARPYLAPFLRNDLHQPNPYQDEDGRWIMLILRRIVTEVQHYLTLLDNFGLVPASTRRFLLDEDTPGEKLLLVPEIAPTDFFRLLENPTPSAVDYWILKGERSVWPAVSALNVRCGIEIAIDRGYETVKRRPKQNGRNSQPGSQI